MSTVIKIIIATILSFSLFSCNFNFNTGVNGNGNVITKERVLEQSFDQIEVSGGMDVYLTQSASESITVEADGNLHELIITEIENNTLKIYPSENINFNAVKKVMVNFKNVKKITSASGSDVYGTHTISQESLELQASSGGAMDLELKTKTLNCSTSSGSDLILKGTADKFHAQASSGSNINAEHLKILFANTKATSGADINVHVSDELIANTASGGDITYSGNPIKIDKSEGVSGHVKQQK
ncbi:head GIN domain-containing protein [Gelidibacter salicanalis]|uniref:DUF2807 domain-containing protein n=1 Tax=Gelidibacter salicanalis TaxID=291193 RepID=A0A934NKJ0_9FLAO|nr:head GIN domain-containing protein [Gelidibacter salicanalis]MBJ7880847.1 DUF2807 domain-containing protein [Gelidibacter salicanalis]